MVILSKAVTLAEVVTTAPAVLSVHRSSFEQRRMHNVGGVFITPEQLRREDGRALSDVMLAHGAKSTRGIPNLRQGVCSPTTYANGVRVVGPPSMSAHDYDAIEFYAGPAQAPPEFGGLGSACGVLLLWMREK
jgi:hypothetical protein